MTACAMSATCCASNDRRTNLLIIGLLNNHMQHRNVISIQIFSRQAD